jgi:hypothetical protein
MMTQPRSTARTLADTRGLRPRLTHFLLPTRGIGLTIAVAYPADVALANVSQRQCNAQHKTCWTRCQRVFENIDRVNACLARCDKVVVDCHAKAPSPKGGARAQNPVSSERSPKHTVRPRSTTPGSADPGSSGSKKSGVNATFR